MRITAVGAALLAAWTFPGCVPLKRTPEARFFTLGPVAERPASAVGGSASDGAIGVLRVTLPGVLERPQLVAWRGGSEIRIDEFLRWAEPLDDGVQRVLAEDVARLLPSYDVVRAPWPGSTTVRCRVRAELDRFGPQPGGEIALSGRFVVLAGHRDRVLLSRDVELRRGGLVTEPGHTVDAMSALMADLAAQIADAVGSLPAETGDAAAGAATHQP